MMKRLKGIISVCLMLSVLAAACACRREAEETTEETTETVTEATENTSVNGASFETVSTTADAETSDSSSSTVEETTTINPDDYIIADETDRTWDLYIDTEEERQHEREDSENGNLSGYVVYDGEGNRIYNVEGTNETCVINVADDADIPYADAENPPDIEEEE